MRIIKLCESLPKSDVARTIGRQLLRSGTSVAANYRAVGRSRSQAEFVAKMGMVIEEADESVFWLELLADSGVVPKHRLENLSIEANELVAIFVASQQTAEGKRTKMKRAFPCSPDHPITRSVGYRFTRSPD
jgi:four helix bundle protein